MWHLKSDITKANRTYSGRSIFQKVILIDNCNACNLSCTMCDHPEHDPISQSPTYGYGALPAVDR